MLIIKLRKIDLRRKWTANPRLSSCGIAARLGAITEDFICILSEKMPGILRSLILCNGVLYDPSYGKTWESQLAWENNGLSGFGSSVPVVDQVPYKPGLRLNWFGESKVAGNNEEETFNNPLANY